MNGMTITALLVAGLFGLMWRRAARKLRDERVTETARYERLAAMYLRCRERYGREVSEHAKTKRELDRARSQGVWP